MKKVRRTVIFGIILLSSELFALSNVSMAQTSGLFDTKSGDSLGGQLEGQLGGSVEIIVQPKSEVHQPFLVGFPDGKFHPQAPLTRAEAAAIVARVKGLKFEGDPEKPYSDVGKKHWAYRYITSVTKAGYMQGYKDGTFHPNEPISRAELVTLVLKVRGIEPLPNLTGFSDTSDHWAKDVIATAKSLGIVDGVGNNSFLPDDDTERQVASKLFCMAFFRGPLKDGETPVKQHFPDVKPEDWSFHWVEEAAVVAHESIRTVAEERLVKYRPDLTENY
ncbi:S-layer homology domain-containing protein [Effusibacillus lacus]|uniref:SLH domain-containing protein n=1 Tax=Effusibacillus lacus TaxID=1348429 RepID=A0A292YPI0_9BACL|nr:S-layer homology domain-containing protein [Effusibacillus lacus]TCS68164.1 S-layer family protein [Effusibacillus lacus]GAX90294.1 hypothetical protein EFBL_1920 [Effusibacillus lacus]